MVERSRDQYDPISEHLMADTIIVIGGGAAGLMAAWMLAPSCSVTLLEARPRLGGRILTQPGMDSVPLELGAEFIHGKPPLLWRLIRETGLKASSVIDRHWELTDHGLKETRDFWEKLAEVTEKIEPGRPDTSFATFLARIHAPRSAKQMAREFVEGFHGAPVEKASVQAIRESEESSEELDGQKQFRLENGYGGLVDFLAARARTANVAIRLEAEARQIRWKGGEVQVDYWQKERPGTLSGRAALVTLPAGVLRSGLFRFLPALPEKEGRFGQIGIGAARKLLLHFREQFWPKADFGFIHTENEWFPTWWSRGHTNLLTGWAGGEKAERLSGRDLGFVQERGLEALARIFGERIGRLKGLLVQAHSHDWLRDPHSLCAYSYVPVNADFSGLSKPVAETIYFAGEATDQDHQLGTVHGALRSGERAAEEILTSLSR
jgi:monoamine oxidase